MATESQGKPECYNFDTASLDDYLYATAIVVTSSEREFFINFICNRPYESSRCVARIVVGEEHLKEILAVLGRQLEIFQKKKKGKSEDSEGGSRFAA